MRLFISIAVVISLMSFAIPSFAQTTKSQNSPRNPITAETVRNSFSAMCKPMISEIINRQKNLLPFVNAEQLGETACTCTTARAFSDTRINGILNLPEQELESRLKSQSFRSYLMGRLMASLYGCLGGDINEQLNNANLEF